MSVLDEIADWLEAARVPLKSFAIINPVFSITEESREQHSLFAALYRVFVQGRGDVVAWLDGAVVHAIVTGTPESLDRKIDETIDRLEAQDISMDDLADLVADQRPRQRDGYLKFDSPPDFGPSFVSHMDETDQTTTKPAASSTNWDSVKHVLRTLDLEHVNEAERLLASRREELERKQRFSNVELMARKLFPELTPVEEITDTRLTELFADRSRRDPSEFTGEDRKQPYVDLVRAFRAAGGTVELDGVEVRLGLKKPYRKNEKAFATMLPLGTPKGVQTFWVPPPLRFVGYSC